MTTTHAKLKSIEISFVQNTHFSSQIILNICTEHGSDTAVLCAKFRNLDPYDIIIFYIRVARIFARFVLIAHTLFAKWFPYCWKSGAWISVYPTLTHVIALKSNLGWISFFRKMRCKILSAWDIIYSCFLFLEDLQTFTSLVDLPPGHWLNFCRILQVWNKN